MLNLPIFNIENLYEEEALMKVDGTDPLILNKIKDQTLRREIRQLEPVEANQRILEEKEKARQNLKGTEGKFYRADLEAAVKQANETAEAINLGIRFKLHEASDRYMVQIVNRVDNEVLKEIPGERILNLIGQIQEMIGLLLDEKR